jgi:hypothetical protein
MLYAFLISAPDEDMWPASYFSHLVPADLLIIQESGLTRKHLKVFAKKISISPKSDFGISPHNHFYDLVILVHVKFETVFI